MHFSVAQSLTAADTGSYYRGNFFFIAETCSEEARI